MAEKIVTPEMRTLLRKSASHDIHEATAGSRELALALLTPLKQGVINGNIIEGIFEDIVFEPGTSIEFPLDFLSPGSEGNHIAYTIPAIGALPEMRINGEYIMVPTYEIGQTIDWAIKYAREARWDVVGRAMKVLEGGFVRKRNNDAFHVLLAAGKSRNVVIYDDAATAGLFTKRLVEMMKIVMRRNAGGNSNSQNRGKLTHLFISPEAHADMSSWDLTQVSDQIRTQLFTSGLLGELADVKLVPIDELGVGQEFQKYFTNVLGAAMPSDKQEIVIGLDLSNNDSFVHPIRQFLQIFERMELHNQRRAGMQGWEEGGWAVLDNRRVLLGAL
jgi:hypothetical protein